MSQTSRLAFAGALQAAIEDINNNTIGYQIDPTSTTNIGQQIQNIHDSMPNSGGAIFIPAKSLTAETFYDWTTAVTITKPIKIYSNSSKGGAVTNAQTPALNMRVASGITALTIGNGTALFGGAFLEGLRFTSVDGTGRAILVNNMSNVSINECTISGFTTGTGIEFTGNSGQYSRINNTYIHGTRTSISGTDYNGVVIDGCFIDPANNSATPVALSKGILITNASADTWSVTNTQIQGAVDCIDSFGAGMRVDNCRFEAFTNGILLKGDRQVVTASNSFNNFIHNSAGRCVDIQATATFADVDKYIYGSVSSEPTIDAGTNTNRRDGILITRQFDLINATGTFIIDIAPRSKNDGVYYARYGAFYVGENAIPQVGGTQWNVAISKVNTSGSVTGLGGAIDSFSGGWTANQKVTFNMLTNNNVVNADDKVRIVVTKTGTPADLLRCSFSMMLVPY